MRILFLLSCVACIAIVTLSVSRHASMQSHDGTSAVKKDCITMPFRYVVVYNKKALQNLGK